MIGRSVQLELPVGASGFHPSPVSVSQQTELPRWERERKW